MADAYATLASGGIRHDPVAIEQGGAPGRQGRTPAAPAAHRVLARAVAWQVTRLLHDNITEGTGTAAYTGCTGQAGKTGTTDNDTDAWFSGYQPNLATAVWVGYPESNAISMTSVHGITVFGGTFPAEIWHGSTKARDPLRGIRRTRRRRSSWAPCFGQFTAAAPADRGIDGEAGGGGEAGAPLPGAELGRRLRPQRLRPRRRPGTGPAPPLPAGRRPAPGVGGGGSPANDPGDAE